MSNKRKPYWFFIVDSDRKLFHVTGPMEFGDQPLTERVYNEIQVGRNMNCFVSQPERVQPTRQQFSADGLREVSLSEIF